MVHCLKKEICITQKMMQIFLCGYTYLYL